MACECEWCNPDVVDGIDGACVVCREITKNRVMGTDVYLCVQCARILKRLSGGGRKFVRYEILIKQLVHNLQWIISQMGRIETCVGESRGAIEAIFEEIDK